MESHRDYLQRRADEEDAAASRAASAKARELHHELATRYRNAATAELETSETDRVNSTRPMDFRILE
ncbi:MAG TPA: hypothetical protein VFH89_00315 [Sphingomicrobium sp.]|nr:hypothetical protein [Sphingomicrobium sp.]